MMLSKSHQITALSSQRVPTTMTSCFLPPLTTAFRRSRCREKFMLNRARFASSSACCPSASATSEVIAGQLSLDVPGLIHGIIVGRPNRFIFNAVIPSLGTTSSVEAHSPAVGKITGYEGMLAFGADAPVRALLSKATGPGAEKRRTKYTVEALDLGPGSDGDVPLFCGINQTKSNEYLAHFLGSGAIPEVLPDGFELRREVTAPDGKSRIDFLATASDGGQIWIENKTMLRSLPISVDNPAYVPYDSKTSYSSPSPERLLKHWETLRALASQPKTKSIVVLTHLLNAAKFEASKQRVGSERRGASSASKTKAMKRVLDAAWSTVNAGVRFVQVNLVYGQPDACGNTAISLGNVFELEV